MATRMSTAAILAMMDKRFGDSKKELLHKASIMENRSPEPRETIRTYDMQLEMKEKERLGIDFNRTASISVQSRWEIVHKLIVEFLQEIISLNDQLSEEAGKQAKQLLNIMITRAQRLGMASRIEQMAGLLMHITFYRTVLKAKLLQMKENTSFLMHCSDLLGFSSPTQIMNRYEALKCTLDEISKDRQSRASMLTALQEKHMEMMDNAEEYHVLLHSTTAALHVKLENLKFEISTLEHFIHDKEEEAAESDYTLNKIKYSIHHCYTSLMSYNSWREIRSCWWLVGIEIILNMSYGYFCRGIDKENLSPTANNTVKSETSPMLGPSIGEPGVGS
ncbi:hypothetical protein PoB_006019500 [Plakobranchus ocellatus]|uniref:Uncharacterized protein n=1 Tax=Plakobranchus ocellatus TaxID=259542 RepID=A0AAV4CP86_9GAST|nr:hypothetical protein PoB_006019500 [Plakobranchus ocellatus]